MVRGLRTAYDDYIRDGLDLMVAGQVALPRLLIKKGIITEAELKEEIQAVLKEIKENKDK